MCVAAIIYKPVPLTDLKEMAESNPHGGGVGWLDPHLKILRFRKGLTAQGVFSLQQQGKLSYPYMLHFRWATHGPKVGGLTHPFPLGRNALRWNLRGSAERLLIHNGTWSDYTRWIQMAYEDGIDMPSKTTLEYTSDTAIAAWLLEYYPELIKEIQWATAIATVENGRIEFSKTGSWEEYNENSYSNLLWLPYASQPESSYTKFWERYMGNKPEYKHGATRYYSPALAAMEKKVEKSKTDSFTNTIWSHNGQVFANFDEYCDAKYGKQDLTEALSHLEEILPEKVDTTGLDPDLVSDDPEQVNRWLAEQMVG